MNDNASPDSTNDMPPLAPDEYEVTWPAGSVLCYGKSKNKGAAFTYYGKMKGGKPSEAESLQLIRNKGDDFVAIDGALVCDDDFDTIRSLIKEKKGSPMHLRMRDIRFWASPKKQVTRTKDPIPIVYAVSQCERTRLPAVEPMMASGVRKEVHPPALLCEEHEQKLLAEITTLRHEIQRLDDLKKYRQAELTQKEAMIRKVQIQDVTILENQLRAIKKQMVETSQKHGDMAHMPQGNDKVSKSPVTALGDSGCVLDTEAKIPCTRALVTHDPLIDNPLLIVPFSRKRKQSSM